MIQFVLDSSVALSWCFRDEGSEATRELLERLAFGGAAVPAHWCLEVTNVLAVAERRKRISAADAAEFLTLLGSLSIEIDACPPWRAFTHLLPLCRRSGLSAYDAAYLDLAIRKRLPLATLDHALRAAAGAVKLDVLGV